MSIFNVDKNSQDRNNPRPNTHDVLTNRPNHGTISTQYQTSPQSATNGFVKMQNQNILVNDGSTNVGLVGYNKALNKWGVYTTPDGTDVTTNTNLAAFTFNSNNNLLQVLEGGIATMGAFSVTNGSAQTNTATLTFAGTYTYAPIVLAFGGLVANSPIVPGVQLLGFEYGSGATMGITLASKYTISSGTTSCTITQEIISSDYGITYTQSSYEVFFYVLQPTQYVI